MPSCKNILILGPFPLPTTGVSLANQVVYESLKKKDNYKVERVNTSYSSFDEKLGKLSLKKALFYFKLQFQSHKVLRNDIIYITPGQTFYGVLKYALYIILASIVGKEIILHLHGNHLGSEYAKLVGIKKNIFHFIISRAHKGVVLSKSLEDNFTPFLPVSKINELKNFVVDDLFIDLETVETKDYSILRIVFLSNLMREKGIFDLLECLQILENNQIPYKARIAGNLSSENKAMLYKYFDFLKHAQYDGVVDVEQKKELLNWSNTFILPTYYSMEGQPISILEAMATGNLILTTDHAGIPAVFRENQNGFYIKKKSPISIFERLKNLSERSDVIAKIAKQNHKEAKENYKVETFINNLTNIIEA